MKKFVMTLSILLASVSAAIAGPIDWIRETLFPVQIIERIVEKFVPVVVPAPTGWILWAILIGVIMILLRGRKLPPAIVDHMPIFPKKATSITKEETPVVQR